MKLWIWEAEGPPEELEQGGENYVNVVLTYEILKMNLRKEGKLDERTSSLKESRMKPETRFCVMHSIILNITWLTDIKFQESYVNYKYNDSGYT